jgi:2',3'-cyclic-nucleotide 2'-phosphodiesterase (5'-nucleotidase family)
LGLIAINDVYSLSNLPRLASLIAHHRQHTAADRWLVVAAGDFIAPSMLSSLDAGRHMVAALNALGCTHAIFGNHEDDVAPSELAARVREFKGTWLGTNVSGFNAPLAATDVIDVAGARVGLVGAVMNDADIYRRPPFGGVRLESPLTAIEREARRLRAEGCQTVIALTHQWIAQDRALAATQAVPLIIGGHEHDPYLEHAGQCIITKSGHDAIEAAIITVTLGATPHVDVRREAVASYPADPAIERIVDDAKALVERLAGAVLVQGLAEPLSSKGARSRQVSMGTFVCRILRDALDAEVALFNGGGLRGSAVHETRLTFGDVLEELPFDNEIVTASIPGSVLKDVVAFSRRRAPAGDGGFLQVDDRTKLAPDGRTIVELAGAPLDEARLYRTAVPRAHLLGLDRLAPFERFANQHPAAVPPAGSGRPPRLILLETLARARLEALGGFAAVDADRDGRVTHEDLSQAMAREGVVPSEATVKLVLDTLDANRDQVLTPDELAEAQRRGT